MLYLVAAVSLSTFIVVLFKLFPKYNIDNLQAIVANYFVAFILGFILVGKPIVPSEIIAYKWLPFAAISGFFLMFVFNVFALSAQKVGVAITAVSSKMSFVVPVFVGFLFYNEALSIIKFIGIITAIAALYFTFKRDDKIKFEWLFLFLPLMLFFGNGTNDALLDYAEKFLIDGKQSLFLAVAFFISFLMGLVFLLIKLFVKKQGFHLKSLLIGFILGVLNFGSTLFFLKSLSLFESSVFFPVFNVSIVSMAALIGFLVFKEPLMKTNWIGIILAVCAIIIMSLV